MARAKKEEAVAAVEGARSAVAADKPSIQAASVPLKPRWDDSKMQSTYANVCNVLGTREEVTLLFGTNKAWQAGSSEVQVDLSHRITLTPYTAKRLAQMLDQGVREYEQRFGEIKLG